MLHIPLKAASALQLTQYRLQSRPKGQAMQDHSMRLRRTQLAVHVLLSGPESQAGAAAVEGVETMLCGPLAWESPAAEDQPSPSQTSAASPLGSSVLDRY